MPNETSVSELWRAVVGHEGKYEVSNLGRVRSITRRVKAGRGRTRINKGRVLSQFPDGYGSLQVMIYKPVRVHTVVAAAFVGPRPDKHDVCHNNGDILDNRPSNLRYDTRGGNLADMDKHGTRSRGEDRWNARLRQQDVCEIYRRACNGEPLAVLAKEFDVATGTIQALREGRTWAWVTGARG